MVNRADLALRLLHKYDLDARQSYAALSRSLGPSTDVITQTLRELESTGVISGYITVVDIGKLGYTGYAVYARLETINEKKLSQFFEYLKACKDIYWVATLGGRFDVLFAVQALSVVQFSEVMGSILKKFPFVSNPEFAIRIRATQFQRAYLVEKPRARAQGGFEVTTSRETLTSREQAVLNKVIEHPRISIVQLARALKITRVTATAVLKRLEQRKIIQGYSALISCSHLGYECYHLLITLKRFDQITRQSMRKFAAEEASIIFCIETMGSWHTELHCEVKTQRELQLMTRKLRTRYAREIAKIEVIPAFEYYVKYQYKTL
jgi:DNA-binding Lrp family transcriptional regulator